jgi:diguanylate cyclase (GGDEF)-like protein/putative nucleotidyltransferase with HDIG domain
MAKLRRVLIVDDEAEIRRLLVDLLSRPGWRIDLASNGQEALDLVHHHDYDVVISDVLMPQLDGMDLLQRVHLIRPKARVILVTGVGTTNWVKQALRLGAFDYVEKPFDLSAFRELVESAIQAKTRGRAKRTAGDGFDPLTSLWTHRHFFEYLAYLRASCRRTNEPLCVLILDIDNFSEINATYGYAAGDEVLMEVTRRVRKVVREVDVVARYGSEEFIVALPATKSSVASRVAQRILAAIRSEPVQVKLAEQRTVTVSIGLAECETGFIETEDELVRRATEALRLAKAQGKDRCVTWRPRDPQDTDAPRADLASVQMLTEQLEDINTRLKQTYLESTRALIAAVEAKDPYTDAHSKTVTLYAEGIARQMNLDAQAVRNIRTAALLHDIGKIGVPDRILTKSGRLTDAEWQVIKRHTVMAVQILEHASFLRAELPIILYHHERWDGTGYPEGLAGERIPLGARILNVADAMDAMFSRRAYKEGYTKERVIEELRKGRGTQFDPQVADAAVAWVLSNPDEIVYPAMRATAQQRVPEPVGVG